MEDLLDAEKLNYPLMFCYSRHLRSEHLTHYGIGDQAWPEIKSILFALLFETSVNLTHYCPMYPAINNQIH